MTEEDLKELDWLVSNAPAHHDTTWGRLLKLYKSLIAAYREQENEVAEKREFVLCMERQLNEAREEIERLRKEVACWSLVWDEDCPNAHNAPRGEAT